MSDILLEVYPNLRFIYRGHTLLITNRNGNVEQGLQGLYEHDVHCRRPSGATRAIRGTLTPAYILTPARLRAGRQALSCGSFNPCSARGAMRLLAC